MSILTLEGLSKNFGSFAAVKDVSMAVQPDEVLCLLGPSGCGKTTTLRMIAGLESATRGSVAFGDQEVTGLPARQRDVAMAFQFYALYPDLTVAENLVYPLKAEKATADECAQRLNRISDILQLGTILHRHPHQLSEGEKQRVAVGRCVIRAPNAFLFDEPLSRLDAKLRDEMRGSIRKILATLDKPTVIVTHDQLEAMTMGDRIAVMREGKVEQIGRPQDVFDRPCNTFVAGFIGTPQMNLLEGQCKAVSETEVILELGGEALVLPGNRFAELTENGEKITLAFRPRAVSPGHAADVIFENAKVVLTENMGAETLVHAEWNDLPIRMLAQGNCRDVGTCLDLGVSVDALTLFNRVGLRLALKSDGGRH
ncbi:ABC transporter ATP-binding protein [Roseibium sp. SCP14]|uniref:ABC transporter ATP-binding protein n=1 Tax=Roseibium sp. SCP14 TaxID=3141375 RepID=UPI00333745B2